MEGNIKVILRQPGTDTLGDLGEIVPGTPIEHTAWARKTPISDTEAVLSGNIKSAIEGVRYRIRSVGFDNIDGSWTLIENGQEYNILGVTFDVTSYRESFIFVHCTRRS